jgi:hypothetical protein
LVSFVPLGQANNCRRADPPVSRLTKGFTRTKRATCGAATGGDPTEEQKQAQLLRRRSWPLYAGGRRRRVLRGDGAAHRVFKRFVQLCSRSCKLPNEFSFQKGTKNA